jgi:heptosyltransferase-3
MASAEPKTRPLRVLVLRSGAIGDFVVALPVLQWLRLAAPGAVIDLACHARVAPLATGLVTQWRDIESTVFLPLYREGPIAETAVAGFLRNYDLILSFLGSRTPVAARLREIAGERAISIDPIPSDGSQHVTASFFSHMREAGLPAPDDEEAAYLLPVIEVEPGKRREARALLEGLGVTPGQAVIAVHPGSGSPKKETPAEVLAEVFAWLREAFDTAVPVIVKGEADEEAVVRLLRRLDPAPSVFETPDLALLAGLLGECALFIGHDSGVSHIAAAVGAPTVAIYVSTDPRVWAPRGPRVALAEPKAASIRAAALSLGGC